MACQQKKFRGTLSRSGKMVGVLRAMREGYHKR